MWDAAIVPRASITSFFWDFKAGINIWVGLSFLIDEGKDYLPFFPS